MLSGSLERPQINPVLATSGAEVGVGAANLSADFGRSHSVQVWSHGLRSQLRSWSTSPSYAPLQSGQRTLDMLCIYFTSLFYLISPPQQMAP